MAASRNARSVAEWNEFDAGKALWIIPAERTKLRREHHVPFAKQAMKVIAELKEITGHRSLLFPDLTNRDRPISENTMNVALRRMGYGQDEMTSHGFRASASTFLNESGK